MFQLGVSTTVWHEKHPCRSFYVLLRQKSLVKNYYYYYDANTKLNSVSLE